MSRDRLPGVSRCAAGLQSRAPHPRPRIDDVREAGNEAAAHTHIKHSPAQRVRLNLPGRVCDSLHEAPCPRCCSVRSRSTALPGTAPNRLFSWLPKDTRHYYSLRHEPAWRGVLRNAMGLRKRAQRLAGRRLDSGIGASTLGLSGGF